MHNDDKYSEPLLLRGLLRHNRLSQKGPLTLSTLLLFYHAVPNHSFDSSFNIYLNPTSTFSPFHPLIKYTPPSIHLHYLSTYYTSAYTEPRWQLSLDIPSRSCLAGNCVSCGLAMETNKLMCLKVIAMTLMVIATMTAIVLGTITEDGS